MKNISIIGPQTQVWLMSLVILIGAAGVAEVVNAVQPFRPGSQLGQIECAMLDKAASARIARLVSDDSAGSSIRLDQAIAQLQLARKHCRDGADIAARENYEALDQLPADEPAVAVQGD